MRRILVIGSPGAGTLARRLAERLRLPLIHLDREYFGPAWAMPSRVEWREKAARPEWVMDGDYASTFGIRIPRATDIVRLDIPRRLCASSVVWRVAGHDGRVRSDLGPGCTERIDWSLLRRIWSYPGTMRGKTARLLERRSAHQRVYVLRSRAQIPALEAEFVSSRGAA